jgi:hypothetical protein
MTIFEELQVWTPQPQNDYVALEKSNDSDMDAEDGENAQSEQGLRAKKQHVLHLVWALLTFTLAFLLALSTWQPRMPLISSYETGFATDFGKCPSSCE